MHISQGYLCLSSSQETFLLISFSTPKEWLGDWDGHSGGPGSPDTVWCLSPLVPSNVGQGQAESGGIVLATVYWAPSSQGGVTRQGVVLTYPLSFVIDSQ